MKKTKQELGELVKELGRLTNIPDPFVAKRIKGIVERILNQTLDVNKTLKYIQLSMATATKSESRAAWATVAKLLEGYFNEVDEKEKA